MILAVAFCPHPPVLVPEIAGAATAEIADLRAACDASVAEVTALAEQVVVFAADPAALDVYPIDAEDGLSGYAGLLNEASSAPGRPRLPLPLPLPLAIGRWLVRGSRPDLHGVRLVTDLAAVDLDPATALVVMGDGSARRGVKAPGYLDDRAAGYDEHVRQVLAAGDPGALVALDAELGGQLLAAGVPSWRAAGDRLGGAAWTGEVGYAGDPFGVFYVVATWLRTTETVPTGPS